MGFRLPTFNLSCRIWSRANVPAGPVITANLGPHRLVVTCQLRAPGKMSTAQDQATFWIFGSELLLPKLTDIRDNFSWDGMALAKPDLVEVPNGSERYYTVVQVDDVAKGFPNEYRFAMLFKNPRWPIPAT